MILPLPAANGIPEKFSGEDSPAILEWLEDGSEIVHPSGPIEWQCTAQNFDGLLVAKGEFRAPFEGLCCRCGRDMKIFVSDVFEISHTIAPDETEADLTSDFRECILLSLPSHPVCDPDCKGLCPRCGKPLADGPCDCGKELGSPQWEALDGFSGISEEDGKN